MGLPETVRSSLALIAVLAPALPACAVDDPTTSAQEAPAEANVYFDVEPDLRRCAGPECGGFFVRRVNAETTRCADGELAGACYVVAIDLEPLGLDGSSELQVRAAASAGRLLARGDLAPGDDGALLAASEAWIAPNDAPASGPYGRVTDRDFRCYVLPCPSLDDDVLNFDAERDLAELDFSGAGLADGYVDLARAAMLGGGVIVAGDDYVVSGPGGQARGLRVSRVHFRAPTRGQDLPL